MRWRPAAARSRWRNTIPPCAPWRRARLHEPEAYWEKLHALPDVQGPIPAGAPQGHRAHDAGARHRVSRGAPRRRTGQPGPRALRGDCATGAAARSPAKPKRWRHPPCVWAKQGKGTAPILYQQILEHAVRCRDPFVRLQKRWIVRRLAPDCSRIELAALPRERDEMRLLYAMGWETANIHLGSVKPRVLVADLEEAEAAAGCWMPRARWKRRCCADFEDYSTR